MQYIATNFGRLQLFPFGAQTDNTHTHTHTQLFYGSMDFVQNNPGELVPEETFTHSDRQTDNTTNIHRQSFIQLIT